MLIIGHEKLINDFKELAAKNNLSGSYLFFGQQRVGKRLFATHLANFLETGEFSEPKVLTDFFSIEPDKEGTIGIDQVRALRNFLWQKPVASRLRTAVINDSEAMTGEAQNAILKIAEEPPESSLLIIIAGDPERLWPTLRSRLQKIYFPPVPAHLIEKWLIKTAGCGADDAEKISETSYGQPGLALSMVSGSDFKSLRQHAERFLKSGFWERRNVIKSMLEDEKFNMSRFLDMLLIVVSKNISGRNYDLWHKICALRQDCESYNLNPRLQLESLLSNQ